MHKSFETVWILGRTNIARLLFKHSASTAVPKSIITFSHSNRNNAKIIHSFEPVSNNVSWCNTKGCCERFIASLLPSWKYLWLTFFYYIFTHFVTIAAWFDALNASTFGDNGQRNYRKRMVFRRQRMEQRNPRCRAIFFKLYWIFFSIITLLNSNQIEMSEQGKGKGQGGFTRRLHCVCNWKQRALEKS
jgi:hypothetical protein